jgi:DNA-binding NarL/FixJ family response regulator
LKPNTPPPKADYQQLLSKGELEVLKLVGQGKNNQEIASTVKNYMTNILSNSGMRDRIQVALTLDTTASRLE